MVFRGEPFSRYNETAKAASPYVLPMRHFIQIGCDSKSNQRGCDYSNSLVTFFTTNG